MRALRTFLAVPFYVAFTVLFAVSVIVDLMGMTVVFAGAWVKGPDQ